MCNLFLFFVFIKCLLINYKFLNYLPIYLIKNIKIMLRILIKSLFNEAKSKVFIVKTKHNLRQRI